MPISNAIVSVEYVKDAELQSKTPSVKEGEFLVYTTDSPSTGKKDYVVFKNNTTSGNSANTPVFDTQFNTKEEFDNVSNVIKTETPTLEQSHINMTSISDLPKEHPLYGLTAAENTAVLEMAKQMPNKKLNHQEIDETINLEIESFSNVTGLFNAGVDKFNIGTPVKGLLDTVKGEFNNIKDKITGIFSKKETNVNIITEDQKNKIQENATKLSQTQEYMVKLEQYNVQPGESLTTWNPDIQTTSSIVFKVMPIVDENRSASYDSLSPTHHPGSVQVYKTTSSRTFNINGKFISRSIEEANTTLAYLNIIRSWVMPYYGSGTADSYPNKIGLPPEILKFNAYGNKNLQDIPVVLTNYSWTYPEDVDYVQAIDTDGKTYPVPRIIEISLSIMECYAPNEISKFDLLAYKNGDLQKAYGK